MSTHLDATSYAGKARTYVRRAAMRLLSQHSASTHGAQQWVLGYEATLLAGEMIDALDSIASIVHADEVDELRRKLREADRALRNTALAELLSNTTGRTPEEAAAFAAKAAQLRGDA